MSERDDESGLDTSVGPLGREVYQLMRGRHQKALPRDRLAALGQAVVTRAFDAVRGGAVRATDWVAGRLQARGASGRLDPVLVALTREGAITGWPLSADEVAAVDRKGCPLIHHAAANGRIEALRWLLARGADPMAPSRAPVTTPIHTAAARGDVAMVELLLARGVPVDALDARLRTPLQAAAANGHAEVVDRLLEHGANPAGASEIDARGVPRPTPDNAPA